MGLVEKKAFARKTRIVIDGKEYTSLADVPAEYRSLLEDKDGDGRPDLVQTLIDRGGPTTQIEISQGPAEHRSLLEDKDGDGRPDFVQEVMDRMSSGGIGNHIEMSTVNTVTTYKVNGREYGSLEEMPPEDRALFKDSDQDGTPDFFQRFAAFRQPQRMGDAKRSDVKPAPLPPRKAPSGGEKPRPSRTFERRRDEFADVHRSEYEPAFGFSDEDRSKDGGHVALLILAVAIVAAASGVVGMLLIAG